MECGSELNCFLFFAGPLLVIGFIIIGIISALKDTTDLIKTKSKSKGESHIDSNSLGDLKYSIEFAKGYLISVSIYLLHNFYTIFSLQKNYYLLITFCLVSYIFLTFINGKKLGIYFPMLGLWLMIVISVFTFLLVSLQTISNISVLGYFMYAISILGFIIFSIFFVRKFGLRVKK